MMDDQPPAIRRLVISSRLCALAIEIEELEQDLRLRKRLLDLKEFEYSEYLIEQAALQRSARSG